MRAADPAPVRHASVLVVDDDAAIARLVRLALRAAGFDAITAVNGAEALERLEDRAADLIVLDLEMPVMGGREFYRRLRATGARVPVVILSAYGAERARTELGAEAAVQKPFEPSELVEVIGRLLK
jgi:CheY-like chemotaxis protein